MINHTDGNNNPEIQCRFGDAIRELGICRLLKESNIRKKKGGSVYEIFQFLHPLTILWVTWLQTRESSSAWLLRFLSITESSGTRGQLCPDGYMVHK